MMPGVQMPEKRRFPGPARAREYDRGKVIAGPEDLGSNAAGNVAHIENSKLAL
jgi:hypothetical protein